MRYLPLLLIILASCSTTKRVNREVTKIDSTVYQELQMYKEASEAMGRKIEQLTTDSQRVTVEFDTLHIHDTITRNIVRFKEGKIVYAEGNIKRIQAQAMRSESIRDSMQTLAYILQDSINTLKASKTIETKIVEKQVRRGWPWWWLVIGVVVGWVGRRYWPVLRYKLFGK